MLTHKEKLNLARRNRTPKEQKNKVSIWLTRFWIHHINIIKARVAREIEQAKIEKEKRKK